MNISGAYHELNLLFRSTSPVPNEHIGGVASLANSLAIH